MSKKIFYITLPLIGLFGALTPSYGGEVFVQSPILSNPGLDQFNQEVKTAPTAINYNRRAEALRRLGLRKEAVDDINRSLQLEPSNVAVLTLKGQVYFEDGMYPEAVTNLNEAIKLDPKFDNGYLMRGRAFLRLKQYSKALDDANTVLAADPKSAPGYVLRGAAYFGLGKYSDAIDDCTSAIKLNPSIVKAYYWRGQAYQANKDYQKSVDDLSKAVSIQSDYRPAQVALALSYYKLGKYL